MSNDNIIKAVTGGGAASVGGTSSDVVKTVASGGAKAVTTGAQIVGGSMSATGLIVSAIIGAVVGITGEVIGGAIDKKAADAANKRSMDIWRRQQAKDEKIRKENLGLARLDRRLQQQNLALKGEQVKTEKDKLSFTKRQTQLQNTLGIINGSQQIKSTFVELFNRRKAA